ncbi:MAG: Glu-tRNA(Gln) amidotransferase subunit GatD [archaeon]|nr:Glu-tRNA(Gln) amidotransferase subunit GatD [archaeon]MCP8321033.1 Glu-tRNA(Gln) amidotransferase subunit GatD [archaeon]
MGELVGYKGSSLELLKKSSAAIGDLIEIITHKMRYEGILMPRYEYADDLHIVIKLPNGYNIGIDVRNIQSIKRISEGVKPHFKAPPKPSINPELPKVSIISTGGTIASRVDYRTGAVHPALSASDLYSVVPELSQYALIDAEVLFSIYSENMKAEYWREIALKVKEKVKDGYQGIVITHGTDTMGYTSAALSFALSNVPIPVVLVGSQRSSDRPSSDAALNLISAVLVASKVPFSGVYVVMHSGISDDILAVHLGTKVRKNHTSRRDAFESVNIPPVAYVRGNKIENIMPDLPPRRDDKDFDVKPDFDVRVALLKFYPNFDPEIIGYLIDKGYRGIVLEGTGLGHVSNYCYEKLRDAIDKGLLVAMTSQCIWGRVRMTVYDTGRDLLNIGVIPLEDMLSETALVKMMWALGNSDSINEAKDLMRRNIAGEINYRSDLERRPVR